MNTYVEKTVRFGKNPMGDWLASKLPQCRLYSVFSQEFQQGFEVRLPVLAAKPTMFQVRKRRERPNMTKRLFGNGGCVVDHQRHDGPLGIHGDLDFLPHPILRIVETPTPVNVSGSEPIATDQYEDHGGAFDLAAQFIGPTRSRRQVAVIDEY